MIFLANLFGVEFILELFQQCSTFMDLEEKTLGIVGKTLFYLFKETFGTKMFLQNVSFFFWIWVTKPSRRFSQNTFRSGKRIFWWLIFRKTVDFCRIWCGKSSDSGKNVSAVLSKLHSTRRKEHFWRNLKKFCLFFNFFSDFELKLPEVSANIFR